MKRFLPLLMVFFLGCSGRDAAMEEALALRSRCLAGKVSFEAQIRADYITNIESFSLDCAFDEKGEMTFRVTEPDEISGIRGTVAGTEGTVVFDGLVLGYPLLADGRLSPLAAPWVMHKALREGCIIAVGREGEKLHLTIDDSYADNALTVELWLEDGQVDQAEIAWEGRRCVTMTVEDFSA